ncbi:MAG: acylphosphatase [Nocardioidaceae bacterium]|nr:acylphosphatase [Nocardioidaceae bacterium]
MIRRRAIVRGHVQGVFFRDSARRLAQEVAVSGSARNLDDGSVELLLEGETGAVEQLLAWAHTGPDGATVESVEVQQQVPQGVAGFDAG